MFTDSMFRLYSNLFNEHAAKYGSLTAIFLQVGGFYELYDIESLATGESVCNVREIAKLCNFSISRHNQVYLNWRDCRNMFGGFPIDSLARYERLLVNAGWTVVVAKQGEKKITGSKEKLERTVDHISSPGCFISEEDGGNQRQLVGCIVESLSPQKLYWAVTALNLSTGAVSFAEGSIVDRLHQFLCVHNPSELVIWSDGGEVTVDLTEALHTLCSATHLKCLGPESAAVDEVTLARFWNLKSLAGWISRHPASRRSVAVLMSFAADHVPSALVRLGEAPVLWVPDGELRLGNAALEQLGLVSIGSGSGSSRKKPQALFDLMNKCRTAAGSRLLRERLLRPIVDVAVLNGRLDRIEAANSRDPVSTERTLRTIGDISALWRRVQIGSAGLKEISALGRTLEAAAALGSADLHTWFAERWLSEPATCGDGLKHPWCPGVYPVIDALFAEGADICLAAQKLCDSWSQLVADGLKSVKGRRQKAGASDEERESIDRLYLDIGEGGEFRITGTKRRVAAALIGLHDSGDSSATVQPFKTTSLLENDQLKRLSAMYREWLDRWNPAWSATWDRAMEELLAAGSGTIHEIEAWCADLDVSWTIAGIAKEWHWTRPLYTDDSKDDSSATISVVGLRHPVIERLIKVPYVSHSIEFKEGETGILLYGMNASGKSSLMKALGLAVLLAQSGCPVPATSFRLRPFTALFTRILGNDNLWAGLSSFAVEMTEFREILQLADGHSLVLGDELCSGTESLSATALVAAGIETLAERGTRFLFATHLHELADMLPSTVKAWHLKVEYNAATDKLIYDRGLSPGAGSPLYGLEVCRALGLPPAYLERAMCLRKQLAGWQVPRRSRYVAEAVVSVCEVCGSTKGLEMHHIVSQAAGGADSAGNLVCLCESCHDAHHGGRLIVDGWEEESVASSGRSLKWRKADVSIKEGHESEEASVGLESWVQEQLFFKISVGTIQRMAKQIYGVTLSPQKIRGFAKKIPA
jgi:DNA mismatch repair protein MutS